MINKLIGGAALLTAAFTVPVLAQPVISDPGRCQAEFPNANCLNLGPGNPYTDGGYGAGAHGAGGYAGGRSYRHQRMSHRSAAHWRESQSYGGQGAWGGDTGFWPAEAAGDVVGGAVGAAGAIATAPFRAVGAWDNGWGNSGWGNNGWDNNNWGNNNWGNNGGWSNANAWDTGSPDLSGINGSNVGTYTAGHVAGNWISCRRGAVVRGVDGVTHRCR